MSDLNCSEVRAAASAHRDRKLPAALAAQIDAHLRACGACRQIHALDGEIAGLLRQNGGSEESQSSHALAARVRGRLIERSLEEIRRPGWQRSLRRGLRKAGPLFRRVLTSRVSIGVLVGLAVVAAYQTGKHQVLSQIEKAEANPQIESEYWGEEERSGDDDLPQLRRLLRDFDAEAQFRRAWSPPEADLRAEDELNPDDFQLVSARRKSSTTPLRAPAALNRLLRDLRLEADFDVIIEARIVHDGRVTQIRLRRQSGGELEISGE